jgi:hypothetical protein
MRLSRTNCKSNCERLMYFEYVGCRSLLLQCLCQLSGAPYFPRPRPRSQTTMSMTVPTIGGEAHHRPARRGCLDGLRVQIRCWRSSQKPRSARARPFGQPVKCEVRSRSRPARLRTRSLPVGHQEPLTALLRFIERVLISEQEIKTAQDAGCDADYCNQERNSSHALSSGEGCGYSAALHGPRVTTKNAGCQWITSKKPAMQFVIFSPRLRERPRLLAITGSGPQAPGG